ncbi:hypothetical protein ANN_14640 [Periplaneta americana]|uniref:Transposable element Tc3 transposase n=1 Tax=Periplaneta americana TaxID=6978 RepID=A0ABQ8SY44_PERAM|nr:hypothetical protein ANN_14640 [Periplaneta americana]
MLEQFLQLQLFADNILDSVVFQQDGAPLHFAHIVRNYLNETFPGRWIGSPRFWAARSPDLTPLDFFAWGHIKTQVYKVKIRDLQHLRERISALVLIGYQGQCGHLFLGKNQYFRVCAHRTVYEVLLKLHREPYLNSGFGYSLHKILRKLVILEEFSKNFRHHGSVIWIRIFNREEHPNLR